MLRENDVTVRLATEADVDTLVALALELAKTLHYYTIPQPEESLRHARQALADARETIFVAEVGGRVVGMCHLTLRQPISEHAPVALIDELIVTAEFQDRGIGKRLIEQARVFALKRGCIELEVGTAAENTSACAFYRAVGFDTEHVLFEMEFEKDQGTPA